MRWKRHNYKDHGLSGYLCLAELPCLVDMASPVLKNQHVSLAAELSESLGKLYSVEDYIHHGWIPDILTGHR